MNVTARQSAVPVNLITPGVTELQLRSDFMIARFHLHARE